MCALYKLIALVALALNCRAQLTPEECQPLTKTLTAADMHKIYGHWVLAAAFADFEAGFEMIANISTSHLDLSLNNDKNTIHYNEMNKDLNGICVSRSSDATVVNGVSTALTLHLGEFVKEEGGVQSNYNADADVLFYQTCPNCLVRIYKATYSGQEARVVFFYRRNGRHIMEVEKLRTYEESMKKQAKCLKFLPDPHYMHDGKPETPSCRAQLTPEQCAPLTKTLPASEIHRIYGHWVLAGAFADFQAGLEMIGKISTSYLDLSLSLNNDKPTIHYHEMNKDLNGKCVSRSSDATVVDGGNTALTLRVGEFVKEEDGVQSNYNADADVVFYQTCPNCLVRIYKATYSGQEARVIFFYRREGKHLEVEKLISYEESMRKQAECLKFLPDSNYMYDGKPVTTSCKAEFTPEQCEPLTKPLPASDSEKYKIYGHWVLAAAFADFEAGLEMIGNISTSRLDLSLNNDKNTIHYNEMNRDLNGKCVSRSSDATVVDGGSTALTLRVGEFVKEEDGVQSKYNADADVVFYQTCANCLVRIYKATYSGQEARVLFFYRREGKHLEVEKLIASEEYLKKRAKCLNFFVDPHYMYDGKSETPTCRAQLTPEQCAPLTKTLPASEIHRIYGHWVLAGAFANFQAGLEMIGKISTSYLHLSLNNDKNTIQYLEMNKDINGKCVSRSSDATVVNGESTAFTLRVGEFVKEEDGVQSNNNADADVVFYQTCPNCLVRIYKATYSGQEAQVIFFYRREGEHMEVEKLIAYEETMRKQAECLKFLPDSNYMYDGKPVTTSCKAEFTPEQCEPLTKPLPASEKYKIYGHWVLAAAFADFEAGFEMIGSISTSRLDLSLNNDKNTIHYNEMNKYLNGKCVSRSSDATVVDGGSTALTLRVGEFLKEEGGVQSVQTADADVVFYQTCPNCLVRIYKSTYSGQEARVIFFYRREGKHLEVEKLIASEESIKKQAKCLKFLVDPHYMYDGKTETPSCRAQLTPEQCAPLTKTLPASEIHRIYGHWVLAGAFADFQAGLRMIGKISTSYLDLSSNNDKNTIQYLEINKDLNGKCVSRSSDGTVVDGESTALTLRVGEFVKEEGGVQSNYNADADVVFYQTCPNCLVRIFKATYSGQEARVLFFYRREGKHLEVEKLIAYEESMRKQAECLKFLPDSNYMYDGKPVTTSCRAEFTPEQCEPLTKPLPASEKYKIYGHWVLAAAFADFEAGLEMIANISTSRLDLSLNDDKNTIHYIEMNKDLRNVCVGRSSNATVVNGENTACTLRVGEFMKEEDGVQSKYNADADVVFYQTCPNCLVRIYKATYSGQEARVLFFYRREGKHLAVEKLIASEEYMKKQAKCLKFLPDPHYMYDGKPETTSCRAQLTPEQCEPLTKTLPASEMQKIYGTWVLAAAFVDFEAGFEMIAKISTSHLDLSLNDDKRTIHYHEMNKDLNNVCVGRSTDATVVNGETTACTLHVGEFIKEQDGVQSKYNADADVVFYQTCPNCLVRIYKANHSGQEARLLFFYRREGEHLEVEKLLASEEYMEKQAKCLKFFDAPHYMYDGKSEVCKQKA